MHAHFREFSTSLTTLEPLDLYLVESTPNVKSQKAKESALACLNALLYKIAVQNCTKY